MKLTGFVVNPKEQEHGTRNDMDAVKAIIENRLAYELIYKHAMTGAYQWISISRLKKLSFMIPT